MADRGRGRRWPGPAVAAGWCAACWHAPSDTPIADDDSLGGGYADGAIDDAAEPVACVEGLSGDALPRRLTAAEYVATVRDSLGVDVADLADRLPADLRASGFSNTAAAMLPTYDHVVAYRELGRAIVQRLDLEQLVADSTPCDRFAAGCEEALVDALARRVWRRPAAPVEVDGLLPIFGAVKAEGEAMPIAAGLVLEAMLQSPRFLYRIEQAGPAISGDIAALDGWSMASRLSYLVWGSSPDAALYEAAQADALADPFAIEAQVRRMLDDSRARERAVAYVEDWLGTTGVEALARNPAIHPAYTTTLASAMRQETRAVAEDLLWARRRPLVELLTTDATFAEPALAALYGVSDPQAGAGRYEALPMRRGVLTHAGVLAIAGAADVPSLVQRGLYVQSVALCGSVVAPPAELDTSMGALPAGTSLREASELRLADPACRGCHEQFDPLGWALHGFDGIGAVRTHDEHDDPIASDGFLPGAPDETWSDALQAIDVIAASPAAQACVGLRRPLQWALGRPLQPGDACMLDDLPLDASWAELMIAIATHPTFRHARVSP